jgi:hypothetical protein
MGYLVPMDRGLVKGNDTKKWRALGVSGVLFFATEPGTESTMLTITRIQGIDPSSLIHDQGYINIEDLRLVWCVILLPSSPVYH